MFGQTKTYVSIAGLSVMSCLDCTLVDFISVLEMEYSSKVSPNLQPITPKITPL